MTTAQPLTCRNCGDLFIASERPCPHPSPGPEYKETGRGGHMFYPPPPSLPREPVTKERLQEIEALALDALNAPTGKRPPYGDTSGHFYLDNAVSVLKNLEHSAPSQEAQDTLFVDLRMACAEVELLRRAAATMPELLTEPSASACGGRC
jgi:hypothetical protein